MAISGTSDCKLFRVGAIPPDPLNHSVGRWNHEGPQVKFDLAWVAVQCMLVLAFLNINCSLFCGYRLL